MEQKTKKNTQKNYSIGIIFVLMSIGLIFSFETYALFKKWYDVKDKASLSEKVYAETALKKSELLEKSTRLQTPEGKERVLREQYRVKNPEEEMVIILHKER